MQDKTKIAEMNFRRANKKMPRCKIWVPLEEISYKNPEALYRYTTQSGKILPRRTTGVAAKIHRKVTREIKRARALNLM